MPLLLTSPKNTGDLDSSAPNGQYKEVRVVQFDVNLINQVIRVVLSYGNTVDGNWARGVLPDFIINIRNEKARTHFDPENNSVSHIEATTDYDDLLTSLPENTEDSLYNQVAKELYNYLIDKGHLEGTII